MFGVLQSDMIQLGNLFTRLLADELRKQGKVASGRMIESITPKVNINATNIELAVFMTDYTKYVASGRKPRTRKVPIAALTQWVIDKSIASNDIEARSIAFAIQRKIYMSGIKPTDFVSMVFEATKKEAEEEIGNGVFKDVEQEVDGIIAQFDGDN